MHVDDMRHGSQLVEGIERPSPFDPCFDRHEKEDSEADEDEAPGQPIQPQQLVNVAEEDEESLEERMEKVHRIAQELLTTEELYVSVLHLIDQVRVRPTNVIHVFFSSQFCNPRCL